MFTESWNVTRCRADMGQKCIRGEGVVVISDLVEGNIALLLVLLIFFSVLFVVFYFCWKIHDENDTYLLHEKHNSKIFYQNLFLKLY